MNTEESGFQILPVVRSDVTDMVSLLNEVDSFYGDEIAETHEERFNQITSALFADPVSVYAIVARRKDSMRAVAFASYSFLWPAAGSSRSLYLKELYIAEDCRRLGLGRLIMHRIFHIASSESCSRVEWTTDSSNSSAQLFYAELGAQQTGSKVMYRYEVP